MAKVRVVINVEVKAQCEEVYLVGSATNIGSWDLENAVKLNYNNESNVYTTTKMFEAGEAVEFKILSQTNWANVEKGMFNEEIVNHVIVPEKGLVAEIVVYNFAA